MVVLDTDHISLLDHGASDAARRLQMRLDDLPAGEAAVTIISFEEQTRGWTGYLAKARSLRQQVEAYGRLKRLGVPVLTEEEFLKKVGRP